MKKTQKVLECLAFIDNKDLSIEELKRLLDEVDSLIPYEIEDVN